MSVYYNEIDPWCCNVLRARTQDGGLLKGFVDERDICKVDAAELVRFTQWHLFCGIGGIPLGLKWAGLRPDTSILTGGFPCQDISSAGKGAGIEGNRSGLWREMFRIIRTVRPAWLLIENVPLLRTRGSDRVLAPLERIGYACWPSVVGAWAVGAPHKRDRTWIVGKLADTERCGQQPGGGHSGGQASARSGWRKLTGHSPEELANALSLGSGPGSEPQQSISGRRRLRRDSDRSCEAGLADASGLESERRGGARYLVEEAGEVETEGNQRERVRDASVHGGQNELANSESIGFGQGRAEPEGEQGRSDAHQCSASSWPARPGEPQHEWESPRLTESSMGGPANGISRRMARERKQRLKALGNAVVPQVVEVFGRWLATQQQRAEGEK